MNNPASITWFARHELGLFWRDWLAMMTAGKASRERMLAGFIAIAAVFMHVLAFLVLAPVIERGIVPSIEVFVFVGGTMILAFSLMLSQAVESVTRAFYARDDLDLIMSSPAMVQRLFAVRIGAISVSSLLMTLFLALPFINVLAIFDDAHWLAAFVVLPAMAAFATSIAIMIIIAMFANIGPARTRLVAQFLAAIVGAAFVIGIQIVGIIYYGNISRFSVLTSDLVYASSPELGSLWWTAVRALMGEMNALIVVMVTGFGTLGGAILFTAPRFGSSVLAASSISRAKNNSKSSSFKFRQLGPARALRMKELALLWRDPWLISQTLMQILYLLPPAFLLWRNFSESNHGLVIVVPVIVMATGQLAGGLAWLAVSGEDAPDLVATAPVPTSLIMRAKIEAVLMAIGAIVLPLVLAMIFVDGWIAIVTAIGVIVCASGSITIQLWFRKQARRTHFRRRQTSSRAATFAEAFSSILWAGASGVAAAGSWLALALAIPALIVLLVARMIAPRKE